MNEKKSGASTFLARRPLAAGLALALAASCASLPTDAAATIRVVTNCLDSGSGSLRDTIGAATTLSGDEVTFSANLSCSTITLSSGEIPIAQHDLSITGPNSATLSISGGETQRVFRHNGSGTLAISGLTITQGKYAASNGAATGGCLRSAGNIVLTNSTVSSCLAHATGSASAYGGGIFASGNLSLIHSRLAYNTATGPSDTPTVFHRVWGGGAFVAGNLVASYSTIYNNSVSTPDHRAGGGGIYAYSNVQIEQSTISNNRADFAAGLSVRSLGGTAVSIVNSTVSGNHASNTIGGISTVAPLTLSNSTVAFNQAAYSRGGLYTRATLTLHSSIIADNIQSDTGEQSDLGGLVGTVVAGFNNLITSSTLATPMDTITACPKLGALVDNGGPTLTHALAHDSPAVNHGNGEQFPAVDQRGPGFPRPFGAGVDIGAYEWQGTPDDRFFNSGLESTCDR